MYPLHSTLRRRHTNDMAPQIIDNYYILNSLFGLTTEAILKISSTYSRIARFLGPTWGPPGSCRPQMGPMLAPWTLLSGFVVFAIQHWPMVSPHNESLRWKTSQCHDVLMIHSDIVLRCLYCVILCFCAPLSVDFIHVLQNCFICTAVATAEALGIRYLRMRVITLIETKRNETEQNHHQQVLSDILCNVSPEMILYMCISLVFAPFPQSVYTRWYSSPVIKISQLHLSTESPSRSLTYWGRNTRAATL